MPCDNLNHYYVPGAYGQCTITHICCMAYSCLANSMAMYTYPCPTALSLIERVDQQQGEVWYHNEANNLHLHDFIWFTWMQSVHRMRDWLMWVQNLDQVLD